MGKTKNADHWNKIKQTKWHVLLNVLPADFIDTHWDCSSIYWQQELNLPITHCTQEPQRFFLRFFPYSMPLNQQTLLSSRLVRLRWRKMWKIQYIYGTTWDYWPFFHWILTSAESLSRQTYTLQTSNVCPNYFHCFRSILCSTSRSLSWQFKR